MLRVEVDHKHQPKEASFHIREGVLTTLRYKTLKTTFLKLFFLLRIEFGRVALFARCLISGDPLALTNLNQCVPSEMLRVHSTQGRTRSRGFTSLQVAEQTKYF